MQRTAAAVEIPMVAIKLPIIGPYIRRLIAFHQMMANLQEYQKMLISTLPLRHTAKM
jgi:hypothetical protein